MDIERGNVRATRELFGSYESVVIRMKIRFAN